MKPTKARLAPALLALLLALINCARPATGGVHLRVPGRALAAAGVTRVLITVSGGDGPTFTPFADELSFSGADWTAAIAGVPVGPQRQFSLEAFDANGSLRFAGAAKSDIVTGADADVLVVLQQLSSPVVVQGAPPVIDYLSSSQGVVQPGAQVSLSAGAHASSMAAAPLSFLWSSSCGSVAQPGGAATVWTAPGLSRARCNLSLTVSGDPGGSVHEALAIRVQPDTSLLEIWGTRTQTFWSASGTAAPLLWAQPAPDVAAGASPPTALVQASPSGWTTFLGGHVAADGSFAPGLFAADGSFLIPGLSLSSRYLLSARSPDGVLFLADTGAADLDLGYDKLGSPGSSLATQPTLVSFDLRGLAPWDSAAWLQLTSADANLSGLAAPSALIAPGATSGPFARDWAAPPAALTLLTSTDVLFLHQLSTDPRADAQGSLRRATSAAAIAGVTLKDGTPAPIVATLAPAAQTGSLPADWSPPLFERHLALLGPSQRTLATRHELSIVASPYARAGAPALFGGEPQLLVWQLPAGAPATTLISPLGYGQFLPTSWQESRKVTFSAAVSYFAAGATTPYVEPSVVERRDVLPAGPATIAPLLSPIRAPLINGLDARADQASAVTSTPLLSWTAPEIGIPTGYLVEVFRLRLAGSATVSAPLLRYATQATQVTLPPGALASGETYYAKITAQLGATPTDSAPLRPASLVARATALSGTFSP